MAYNTSSEIYKKVNLSLKNNTRGEGGNDTQRGLG